MPRAKSQGNIMACRMSEAAPFANFGTPCWVTLGPTTSLWSATQITLIIEMPTTDASFGETENLYVFSGGFEDLALITKSGATSIASMCHITRLSAFASSHPEPS